MVNIVSVDLRARGIELPSDRVGMVVAQPFLSLTPHEPFVCTLETAPAQLAMIQRPLEIEKAPPRGQPKTPFRISPKYPIPGPGGVAAGEAGLGAAAWPTATAVIGGL